ncbi:MAG: PilZ domain-containing protein [Syntrophorhabdaceae bacterium]|nr:PilZ domain-containing protein [Syntrophorhabdaceae bacterium]
MVGKAENKGREFFRVNVRIPVEFRRLTLEEYKDMEDIVKYSSIVKRERPEIESPKGFIDRDEKDSLFIYLEMINRKLDMVIELLKQTERDDSYIKRFFDVNLSGSGMKFLSDIEFCEGDFIEMRLAIPGLPLSKITTLCEVVRAKRIEEDTLSLWEVGLKFNVINEEDRDLLVSFIFARERELLRARKDYR